MYTDDLLNKAKAGDRQALLSWMGNYHTLIAGLAYQAGIPKEKIRKFQLDLVEELGQRIGSIDHHNAEDKIMESAIHLFKKKQAETVQHQDELSFKFEEDEETHKAIQRLPLQEKLVLILFQFHGRNPSAIADILGESEASIESALAAASAELEKNLALMGKGDIQKRLDFLSKSYNRIEFDDEESIQVEMLEEAPQEEEPANDSKTEEKMPVNRKTFATLAGASLFLSAVIGASFLFNDQPDEIPQTAAEEGEEENPTIVTKAMVEKWEREYEEIRQSAPDLLGLNAETFDQLEYVKKADALKERTFSRQKVKQLKDDPERMQEQVDVLMLNIHTPKGMLDSVADYKLLTSETGKFLQIYTEKTDELMAVADGLLKEYQKELLAAEVNGELSPEKLVNSRGDYPAAIEDLTSALSEYTFRYTVHPNEDRFRTMRDITKFYETHPFSSDMLSMQYLDVLWNTPVFDDTGMLWPIEQLPQAIISMSTFLSDPMADPALKENVEPQLIHAFFTLLKGDEDNEIFDRNGVVKEEIQTVWESLLQFNSNPVTFMMLPILDEFEESGWKESAHYEQLAYGDILHAIAMENNGELAEKLPNGDLEIESASLVLEDYDYSDIKPLYEKFSATHDLQLLSGSEPMETIKLYYYANKLEDIETMWHLTADDELKPSLEDYIKKWRKRPELTESMRNIEIFEDNLHRQGRKLYLMAFGENIAVSSNYGYMENNLMLVTEKDKIWLMQHQLDEHYAKEENFETYDANVRNYYQDLLDNGSMDSVHLATPAEIAGVFLLALEKEDLKTMRLMVNEMDDSISDEEFKERWLSGHLTGYSEMTGISFTADIFNMGVSGVRGGVNIINKSDSMEDIRYMQMEKVEDSWMIGDMFGY